MLVNKNLMPKKDMHVKFVSYTGKWPNLCGGNLTLEIDSETVMFKSCDRFWSAGGECDMRTLVTGPWVIDVEKIPEKYRKYAAEIDEVFNENVERGHCGGCR